MTSHVRRCGSQNPGRILQQADSDIARVAQNATNSAGLVVMVEIRAGRRAAADCAEAILRFKDGVELGWGDPVVTLSCPSCFGFAADRTVSPLLDARPTLSSWISTERWPGNPIGMPASACVAKLPLFCAQWVAISLPAVVVGRAQSPRRGNSRAVLNGADEDLTKMTPGFNDKRVAVRPPAHVVRLAPAARSGCTGAIGNGAVRLGLHQGVKTSLVWPAVAMNNRRFYCAARTLRCR
jgi:hypothetical protein